MTKVDFHVHTTSSDGVLTPKEVVKIASNNGVEYLAITDHDTVSGLDEAIKEAAKLNIKLIPGIELSTNYNKESIHILGFFKDDSYINDEFIKALDGIKNERIIRAKKMISKLKEIFNIEISFEAIMLDGKNLIARPHIAKEIIKAGYPYDMDKVFKELIGNDCPAFIPTTKLSTEDGIKLLKKYNALVFLAHPILISKSPIDDFLSLGLDGIEAIYFQNSHEDEKSLIEIALNNNLLVSAGSDCHGYFKNDKRHGCIGCMTMKAEYLENFLSAYLD
ncbi:MAG TPA: PHP domain-containing protein [Clostridium sp.]